MINYQDMTFCEFHECVKAAACPRSLTPEIIRDADSAGRPILIYIMPPSCLHLLPPKEVGE